MKNFPCKFFLSIILFLIPFSVFSSGYKGNVLLEYPMIQENGKNEYVVVEIPNLNTYPPQWWSPPYLGMGKWKCFFSRRDSTEVHVSRIKVRCHTGKENNPNRPLDIGMTLMISSWECHLRNTKHLISLHQIHHPDKEWSIGSMFIHCKI